MKSGRAQIGIFQKMRIKNLRGVSEVRFKKLDSFTLETSKNNLIRNFLRNGRLRVKSLEIFNDIEDKRSFLNAQLEQVRIYVPIFVLIFVKLLSFFLIFIIKIKKSIKLLMNTLQAQNLHIRN